MENNNPLLHAHKVGLEINVEKIKYMFMSCHQDDGQNCNTYQYNYNILWKCVNVQATGNSSNKSKFQSGRN